MNSSSNLSDKILRRYSIDHDGIRNKNLTNNKHMSSQKSMHSCDENYRQSTLATYEKKSSLIRSNTLQMDDISPKHEYKNQIQTNPSKHQHTTQDFWMLFVKALAFFPSFVFHAIPLAFQTLNPIFQNLISCYLISQSSNLNIMNGFAIGCSIQHLSYNIPIAVSSDCVGKYVLKALVEKNLSKMRIAFYRGIILNFIWTILITGFFSRIDLILYLLGFQEDLCYRIGRMLVALIPSLFIQAFNDSLRAYLISVGICSSLYFVNTIIQILTISMAYFFISLNEWWLLGYAILRYVIEFWNMIMLITIYKKQCPAEMSQFLESWKDIFDGFFRRFCWTWFKGICRNQAECIGCELNIFIQWFYGLENSVIAWMFVMNINAFIGTLGFGLANITRKLIETAFGQMEYNLSKIYAIKCWILSFVLSILFSILIMSFSQEIADILTVVPGINYQLQQMLLLLGIMLIFSFSAPVYSTILLMVQKFNVYILTTVICQIGIWNTWTYIILNNFDLNYCGRWIVIGGIISWALITIICVVFFVRLDFKEQINKHDKKCGQNANDKRHELYLALIAMPEEIQAYTMDSVFQREDRYRFMLSKLWLESKDNHLHGQKFQNIFDIKKKSQGEEHLYHGSHSQSCIKSQVSGSKVAEFGSKKSMEMPRGKNYKKGKNIQQNFAISSTNKNLFDGYLEKLKRDSYEYNGGDKFEKYRNSALIFEGNEDDPSYKDSRNSTRKLDKLCQSQNGKFFPFKEIQIQILGMMMTWRIRGCRKVIILMCIGEMMKRIRTMSKVKIKFEFFQLFYVNSIANFC